MPIECPICVEEKILSITCPKCNFSSCRDCVERYLLDLKETNPKCMSCSIQWNTEFLADNTANSFHNEKYRNHTAKIILDREKGLLPATQPLAILEKEKDYIQYEIQVYYFLWKEAKQKKSILAQRRPLTGNPEDPKNLNVFLGHCPESECKGFILPDFTCGICKAEVCKKCRTAVHEDKCDKNILKTVKMLAKDTKSCPSCSIPIHKISGCPQMFCVNCHTAFDWDSGKIATGRIHNPHYYEWQRNNGGKQREVGDVRCGGLVGFGELRNHLDELKIENKIKNWLYNAHRFSCHVRAVVIPYYAQNTQIGINSYQDLRIRYLLDYINEDAWLKEIKKREKKREKLYAIQQVIMMFIDTLDDLLNNLLENNKKNVNDTINQIRKLQVYAQTNLNKVAKRFKNKVPIISVDWEFDSAIGYNYNFTIDDKQWRRRR